MRSPFRRRLLIVTVLLLIAAALHIYHLGASPLRGDEAFTVRYWAAVPAFVISQLAGVEPHPLGAMLGFGAWKTLVGDSEFAMRYLPALLNLVGVPALYGLGRRMFRDDWIGLVAALLWTLNPYQLWHAQDVRSYAIWSALSAVAMWLLIVASERRRRLDWALYVIAAVIALYSFFLEAFFIAAGGLFVLIRRPQARRGWLISAPVIGVLLIPWLAQAWALAHSGYKGTALHADIPALWTQFLPALFSGEVNPALADVWSTLLLLLTISALWLVRRGRTSTLLFLVIYAGLPALLLTLVATRIAVFQPRYLIAATPPLLLLAAFGITSLHRALSYRAPIMAWGVNGLLALTFIVTPLIAYGQSHKAPDWFGLRDYLQAHAQSGDLVLLTTLDPATGNGDPAFDYYYHNGADVTSLPRTGTDSAAFIREAATHYRAIWFVPSGIYAGDVDRALRANTQLISDEGAGRDVIVREYRANDLKAAEITNARVIAAGDFALRGYSLEWSAQHLTAILFWQPGAHTSDTVFVHLIGAINPTSGTRLWAQLDHPPMQAARDIYRLDLAGVPVGNYRIEIGLYDPGTDKRRSLTDGDGQSLGDSALLANFSVR